MIGKAICLLVVLVIAAHAADTYADSSSESLADSAMGPDAVVSLAETGSTLSKWVESYALDPVHRDDEFALHDYEEESAKRRKDRKDRRRRRASKRRQLREEARIAAENELSREERRYQKAKRARRQSRRGRIPKKRLRVPKKRLNLTLSDDQKRVHARLERNQRLRKKDLKLLKRARKLERKARRHRSQAKDLDAIAAANAAQRFEHSENAKWSRRDHSTEFAVNAGTGQVRALQGEYETEDLRADIRFWDSYYGKKKQAGKKVKKTRKSTPNAVKDVKNAKKGMSKKGKGKKGKGKKGKGKATIDRSLALYNASHIASFKEVYGKTKLKKLDAELLRDGDTYMKFAAQLL